MAIDLNWPPRPLGEIATLQRGFDLPFRLRERGPYPIVTSSGVEDFHSIAKVKGPGVVTGRYGTIGQVFFISGAFWPLNTTLYVKDFHGNDPQFVAYLLRTIDFKEHSGKTGVPGINRNDLHQVLVSVPSDRKVQEKIAEALSDADTLIEALEQLLAKKRQIKQGAMQELLTGKKRLPGFERPWEEKRIADIAFPVAERNQSRADYPVLTCSKHRGFVDSLRFFKNQVFSDDTSGYKVIRQGQIGYPANHIEEGSIGLQDLYETALVSPIYVVFNVRAGMNSFFLHRLLKLDSFRQRFAVATSASVDRRGSLRWPAFSEITVKLPEVEEQDAISTRLADFEAEVASLEAQVVKSRHIKQAMMQELLTGRIRLI